MDVTPWLSMRQVCFPSHSWAFLETYSFFLSWLPYSPRYAGHITVIFLVINTYWTYTFTAKLNISSVTLQPSVPKLQCLPLKKGNKCIHASWGFKGEFGSCDLRILHFTASMFSDMKMSKHFELYKYVFFAYGSKWRPLSGSWEYLFFPKLKRLNAMWWWIQE